MRMENSGGDSLARGAVSHTFRPMGERVTQAKWDAMFEPEVKADENVPKSSGDSVSDATGDSST